jgi:hypothetical protein
MVVANCEARTLTGYHMRPVLQIIGGFVGIAGLLAFLALALYVVWWIVLIVVSFLPIIGKKHKHRDWDQLQKFTKPKSNASNRHLG